MIKCEVDDCLNNDNGECKLESICLNFNRRCTNHLTEEDVKRMKMGLPPRGTTVVFHCED